MTGGAQSREKNFLWTPTELVSSDQVKSQHRWLKMQPFSPTRLVAMECRSLIHDLERRGDERSRTRKCGGWLLKHVSVNFLFILALPQLLGEPSIKTFFVLWPEILMIEERRGVGERVESAVTVRVYGWLNYNLWFIRSSWRCQRRGGKELSLWQGGILEAGFVPTNVGFPQHSCIKSYKSFPLFPENQRRISLKRTFIDPQTTNCWYWNAFTITPALSFITIITASGQHGQL